MTAQSVYYASGIKGNLAADDHSVGFLSREGNTSRPRLLVDNLSGQNLPFHRDSRSNKITSLLGKGGMGELSTDGGKHAGGVTARSCSTSP